VINELVSDCHDLVDGQTLNLSDIDLEFVATNAGIKNNPRNPERQLVRYQLMEYFVRIAKTKFLKNKICKNMVEATEKIYKEHLKKRFESYDCHKWRTTYLWNEHCDYVFKRYMTAIKKIYEKFSGRYAMPGATKYMSSDEFFDLVDLIGIVDDSFGQREVIPIFNCSMMTQKNELDSDRHINMTLIEFIEAIGRVAFKIKVPNMPFEYMKYMLEEMIEDNPNFKASPPLHYKIEALIVMMVKA
jgi:NLR family CARD domain-containing protein 3